MHEQSLYSWDTSYAVVNQHPWHTAIRYQLTQICQGAGFEGVRRVSTAVSVFYGVKGNIADMAWSSGSRSLHEKLRWPRARKSSSGRQFASEPYPRLSRAQGPSSGSRRIALRALFRPSHKTHISWQVNLTIRAVNSAQIPADSCVCEI